MGEKKVEKTVETTDHRGPTVPIETVTSEEETTTSVPAYEVTREEHRVAGRPDQAVTETTVTETTEK